MPGRWSGFAHLPCMSCWALAASSSLTYVMTAHPLLPGRMRLAISPILANSVYKRLVCRWAKNPPTQTLLWAASFTALESGAVGCTIEGGAGGGGSCGAASSSMDWRDCMAMPMAVISSVWTSTCRWVCWWSWRFSAWCRATLSCSSESVWVSCFIVSDNVFCVCCSPCKPCMRGWTVAAKSCCWCGNVPGIVCWVCALLLAAEIMAFKGVSPLENKLCGRGYIAPGHGVCCAAYGVGCGGYG